MLKSERMLNLFLMKVDYYELVEDAFGQKADIIILWAYFS